MDTRNGVDLSKYRFERAEAVLKTAQNNLTGGDTNSSVNRSHTMQFFTEC